MKNSNHENFILVLSSPSGAGKTSLSRTIRENDSQIQFSISYTTRCPRPGEVDGKDYYFISEETFAQMKSQKAFLEWASVFGNLYGTGKERTYELFKAGFDVIFDIDWQGARQLRTSQPENVVSIFILPPTLKSLHERLVNRHQDPPHVIDNRMKKAWSEIAHWKEYDYIIINDHFETSVKKIQNIIQAERLKRHRWIGADLFIRELNKEFESLCGDDVS